MNTKKNPRNRGRLPNVSFRVSDQVKSALHDRAVARSVGERREVTISEVAREILEFGLDMLGTYAAPNDLEDLVDDVMSSALYSKMALQLLLHDHREMSDRLLEACRAELKRRKRGHRFLPSRS